MPPVSDASIYVQTLEAMMAGHWSQADTLASSFGFEIVFVSEGDSWFAVLQDFSLDGINPLVVINPNATKSLIAEAQHPSFERGTIAQAALFLSEIGGQAAIIAGAYRCAAEEQTSCSGKTRVCETETVLHIQFRTSRIQQTICFILHMLL